MKRLVLTALLGLTMSWATAAPDGAAVYTAHCAACHQPDGAGAVGLAPPLQGTLGARLNQPAGRNYLAGVLVSGLAGKIESKGVVYNGIMPNWQQLPDAELAAVLNHVLTAFNAAELPVGHQPYSETALTEMRARKPSGKELRAWRAESDTK